MYIYICINQWKRHTKWITTSRSHWIYPLNLYFFNIINTNKKYATFLTFLCRLRIFHIPATPATFLLDHVLMRSCEIKRLSWHIFIFSELIFPCKTTYAKVVYQASFITKIRKNLTAGCQEMLQNAYFSNLFRHFQPQKMFSCKTAYTIF